MTQPPTLPSAGAGSSVSLPVLLPGQFSSVSDWEEYCSEYVVHARRAGVPQAVIESTIGIVDTAVEAAGQFRNAEIYYWAPCGRRFGQCSTATDETAGENQQRLGLEEDPFKQTEELSAAHSTTPAGPCPAAPRLPSPSRPEVASWEPSTPPPAARSPPPPKMPSAAPPRVPSPSPAPSPPHSPSSSPAPSPLRSSSLSPPPALGPSTPRGPSPSPPTVPSPSLSPSLDPSPSPSPPPSPPRIPSPQSEPRGSLRGAAPTNVGAQVQDVRKYRSTLEFAKRLDRFYAEFGQGKPLYAEAATCTTRHLGVLSTVLHHRTFGFDGACDSDSDDNGEDPETGRCQFPESESLSGSRSGTHDQAQPPTEIGSALGLQEVWTVENDGSGHYGTSGPDRYSAESGGSTTETDSQAGVYRTTEQHAARPTAPRTSPESQAGKGATPEQHSSCTPQVDNEHWWRRQSTTGIAEQHRQTFPDLSGHPLSITGDYTDYHARNCDLTGSSVLLSEDVEEIPDDHGGERMETALREAVMDWMDADDGDDADRSENGGSQESDDPPSPVDGPQKDKHKPRARSSSSPGVPYHPVSPINVLDSRHRGPHSRPHSPRAFEHSSGRGIIRLFGIQWTSDMVPEHVIDSTDDENSVYQETGQMMMRAEQQRLEEEQERQMLGAEGRGELQEVAVDENDDLSSEGGVSLQEDDGRPFYPGHMSLDGSEQDAPDNIAGSRTGAAGNEDGSDTPAATPTPRPRRSPNPADMDTAEPGMAGARNNRPRETEGAQNAQSPGATVPHSFNPEAAEFRPSVAPAARMRQRRVGSRAARGLYTAPQQTTAEVAQTNETEWKELSEDEMWREKARQFLELGF